MNIAVVIPAFKESQNIEKLIKLILKVLKDPYIVIVDDSPDKETEKIVKNFHNINYVYRGKKLGRGSAVVEGMKKIIKKNKIDKIIEMDADLSHDPNEIEENLNYFEKENLDLLISSRYLKDSQVINWSMQRKVFSFLSNKLARLLLKIPVTDYTNGFRIYSKKSAEHIALNCGKIGSGFVVLSEQLVELYFNGYKVDERPTIFKNRVRGESSVNINEISNALLGLFKIYKRKKEILKIKKVLV